MIKSMSQFRNTILLRNQKTLQESPTLGNTSQATGRNATLTRKMMTNVQLKLSESCHPFGYVSICIYCFDCFFYELPAETRHAF